MGGLMIGLLIIFLIAVFVVLILAVVGLVLAGASAVAITAGGLAGAAAIRDGRTKSLALLVSGGVFSFGVSCFAMAGYIFWAEHKTPMAAVGIGSAVATLGLGLAGFINTRHVARTAVKIIFYILFPICIALSVLALIVFAAALFATIRR